MPAQVRTGIQINQADLAALKKKMADLHYFSFNGVEQSVRHNGNKAVAKAKNNATRMGAVDTGRLRRNIEGKMTGTGKNTEFIIESEAFDPETGLDYAPTVHWGLARRGRNAQPRPYLQEAFRYLIHELHKDLTRRLREITRKR